MKICNMLLVSMFIGAVASPLAIAQDFDAGKQAADRGDFATALDNWRPLAEAGNANAQFNLGMMYGRGDGVAQDYATAARWFTSAAEQDHVQAQARLGAMYARGLGVPQDDAAAVRWLTRAAEQHHAQSQYDLGVLYANGQGVSQDYSQAYFWFTVAGLQNFYPAIEGQQEIRRFMDQGQIAYVEQQVRDWLKANADIEFERQPGS